MVYPPDDYNPPDNPEPPDEEIPDEPIPLTNVEGSVIRYAIPMGVSALVLIGTALIPGKKKKKGEEDKDV